MDKKKTGNLIKEARTKKGYTQQELGDLVGVTNKAISRWENGEAFPDVSLLDTLSYTLDLDINEIVLGEKKEDKDNKVALEMVQIARMEKNRKTRLFNIKCIVGIVFVLLFIGGIRTIAYGLYEWPVQIIYYECALCVFLASCIRVKRNSSSLQNREKISTVVAVISGLSDIYGIILVCGTLELLIQGIHILGLMDAQIGPFINYQLLAVFLINLSAAFYFVWSVFAKDTSVGIGLHLSIAGIFLSMVYSDLLHRLNSIDDFALMFVLDTAVITGIIVVGAAVAYAVCRKID